MYFLAVNSVNITGLIKYDVSPVSNNFRKIHATFSLGPHQVLNWYFNNVLIKPTTPQYAMETDGLNILFRVNTQLPGTYKLKIEGTDISDYIKLHLGI